MIANLFGPDLGIIIVVIVVVLLGGSQLPKIARNVGTAGREFRKAQQEAEEDAAKEQAAKAAAAQATPPPAQPLPPAAGDESVQLSRAQLDALLKEREEQVRRETGSPSA
ncbi:MAG TPA: twin-arginine translocase TatA/TatE family subunit [Acidimicrobiales bacterium]|nr:twin-arginine translocase TatA/TatE family subunit [Acidimicrobiales bacterium]